MNELHIVEVPDDYSPGGVVLGFTFLLQSNQNKDFSRLACVFALFVHGDQCKAPRHRDQFGRSRLPGLSSFVAAN